MSAAPPQRGYTAPPYEPALRAQALESLLTEKGLVDKAEIDAIIDLSENKVGPRNGAQIVARAWTDPVQGMAARRRRGSHRVGGLLGSRARAHRRGGPGPSRPDAGSQAQVNLPMKIQQPTAAADALRGRPSMDIQPTFLDCPAYLNQQDLHRCGLPAEVKCRFIMRSTSGPLESAMIRCPVGHFFNGPIEFLSLERHPGVCSRSASQTMSTSIGQPAEVGHDPD